MVPSLDRNLKYLRLHSDCEVHDQESDGGAGRLRSEHRSGHGAVGGLWLILSVCYDGDVFHVLGVMVLYCD